MKLYWKVRIYRNDNYAIGQIETDRDLREIDRIQDFYFELTGSRMLLEGMAESKYIGVISINDAFRILWEKSS